MTISDARIRFGRYSPRPQSIDAIRQFRLEAALDYTVAADTGTVETRQTPTRIFDGI
ncbi:MAG: hypothetical protein Ct9H300mP25_12080 [Acidobacteriota bacterium]|nr:MAG: hypothetical protein Ct9H300mP25_12080 [Acidobacteriota bacterium]